MNIIRKINPQLLEAYLFASNPAIMDGIRRKFRTDPMRYLTRPGIDQSIRSHLFTSFRDKAFIDAYLCLAVLPDYDDETIEQMVKRVAGHVWTQISQLDDTPVECLSDLLEEGTLPNVQRFYCLWFLYHYLRGDEIDDAMPVFFADEHADIYTAGDLYASLAGSQIPKYLVKYRKDLPDPTPLFKQIEEAISHIRSNDTEDFSYFQSRCACMYGFDMNRLYDVNLDAKFMCHVFETAMMVFPLEKHLPSYLFDDENAQGGDTVLTDKTRKIRSIRQSIDKQLSCFADMPHELAKPEGIDYISSILREIFVASVIYMMTNAHQQTKLAMLENWKRAVTAETSCKGLHARMSIIKKKDSHTDQLAHKTQRQENSIQRLEREISQLRKENHSLKAEREEMKAFLRQREKEEELEEAESENEADAEENDEGITSIQDLDIPDGTILFGGHPRWQKFFQQDYPNVSVYDGNDSTFTKTIISNQTPLVLLNTSHMSHTCFNKVTQLCKRHATKYLCLYGGNQNIRVMQP